jgi:cell fate regulator YaaT (PSP1 superfamily)
MGCGNCGTGANGAPSGCKSNGGCSTGGCNRLNVYDWLNALPLHDSAKPYPIIEVSFSKGSRKEFFRNNTHYIIEKGTWLAVEGLGGYDIGQVSLTGELVKLQLKKYGVRETDVTKRVLHPATEEELEESVKQKNREPELLIRSRAIARSLKLEMKLCEIEIQADSKKGTFFYTADQRVDFRELIKLYAGDFKMKVEMRQIGARQESGKVGGIGSCGRELCCSTWLTDFKSVNTTAARYQNLSINQTKLSGQCGRLKCCLNYELDTYMDALSVFPDHAESLETIKGIAHLQKRDIFKNLMWYSYSDNNKQYPLSIERVKEIKLLNKQGQKAEDLQPVELEAKGTKDGIKVDMGFVNDVGQLSLRSLEKNNKKKKHSGSGNKNRQDEGGRPQGAGNASAADGESAGNQPRGNRPRPDQGARGSQNNQPRNNRPRREDAAATGEQQPKTNNQPKTGGSEREPQQARNPQQKGQQQQGNRPPRNNDQQGRKPEGTTSPRPPREGAANPENGAPRNQPTKRPDRPQNNQNQQKRPQQQRPNQSAKPTESENKQEEAQ